MTGYPSSHQYTSSRPAEVRLDTYLFLELLQHIPTLDNYEAAEKCQSIWSAFFWLEERPQPHVSSLCTFTSRVLQQLSALRQKLLSCMQSMWAATNSVCQRISVTFSPIHGL
ncbi:hypothetical protein CIHG_06087 [Coccidioides immitis H538.4]|uniref:Uncharacterized protein n=1 Tax=Coccidioides immitis H538.4 TaxID=396776 RepID=A0A0J8RSV1_COCIT|nr:hypothetical protein CIHG_06087 [Coccidioides immitis H538.4]